MMAEGDFAEDSSSLEFELQEVIRSSSPKYEGAAGRGVEALAREVREVVMKTQTSEELDNAITKKICIPRPAKRVACILKTSECAVVGSWLTRTCARPKNAGLDVSATIEGIVAKDYLNGRYWEKRWQYCLCLKAALEKKNDLQVQIEDLNGDSRRPVLVVTSRKSKFYVRVLPSLPDGIVPLAKLAPHCNAVRASNGQYDLATFRYNDAMLRDRSAVMKRHVSLIFKAVREMPLLADAIVLAKVWLASACPDLELDGTAISLLCLHAATTSNHKSRLALFRTFLRLIAEHWSPDQSIILQLDDNDQHDKEWTAEAYRAAGHEVVALDATARINVATRLSLAAFHELRYQAQQALKAARVDAPLAARKALFIERPNFLRYDAIITIPILPNDIDESTAFLAAPGDERDALGEPLAECLGRYTVSLIREALEQRATAVLLVSNHSSNDCIRLGVRLREDTAFRPALRGPRPDEIEKVAKFRAFWGDRAETRRFRDGDIREAVVWTSNETSDLVDWRRSIPERCVRYALDRHLKSRCLTDRRFLYDSPLYAKVNRLALTANAFTEVQRHVDTLDLACRSISLPLRLDALTPAAASLRDTDPSGVPEPTYLLAPPGSMQSEATVAEIVLVARFERSAKWVKLETESARRAAATALLARLARQLTTDESLADHLRCIGFVESNELRIGYAGFLFRIKPDFPQPQTNVLLPTPNLFAVHHATIRSLTARFSSLGPTVRLLARWSASQHFSSHLSHEVLELLAVAVFISPSYADTYDCLGFSSEPPVSPLSGFMSCLRLLWKRDWTTRPLYLALREAAAASPSETPAALFFPQSETRAPSYPLSIVAGYDEGFFTDDAKRAQAAALTRLSTAPELPVLRLIQSVAKSTERTLSQSGLLKDEEDTVIETIFGKGAAAGRETKRALDAWLVLRKPQRKCNNKNIYANLDNPAARLAFATNRAEATLDPVLSPFEESRHQAVHDLVYELIENFGHFALFFYNELEPSIIGIVWRPSKPEPLATMEAAYTQPTESPSLADNRIHVQPNCKKILADCQRIAGNLVTAVKQRADLIIPLTGNGASLSNKKKKKRPPLGDDDANHSDDAENMGLEGLSSHHHEQQQQQGMERTPPAGRRQKKKRTEKIEDRKKE